MHHHRRRDCHDLWHESYRRTGAVAAEASPEISWSRRAQRLVLGWHSSYGDFLLFVTDTLSWQPISFVIPASALSNVVGTLGAKYILKEEVNAARWAGVILVCAGVALVAIG